MMVHPHYHSLPQPPLSLHSCYHSPPRAAAVASHLLPRSHHSACFPSSLTPHRTLFLPYSGCDQSDDPHCGLEAEACTLQVYLQTHRLPESKSWPRLQACPPAEDRFLPHLQQLGDDLLSDSQLFLFSPLPEPILSLSNLYLGLLSGLMIVLKHQLNVREWAG